MIYLESVTPFVDKSLNKLTWCGLVPQFSLPTAENPAAKVIVKHMILAVLEPICPYIAVLGFLPWIRYLVQTIAAGINNRNAKHAKTAWTTMSL